MDVLPYETGAVLVGPRSPTDPYEIHLTRGSARFADHLIAHEVGHIVRLHQVSAAERLMPVITPASAERAIEQASPELSSILMDWPDPDGLGDLVFEWISGVVTQLASFPADLRIEAWLHEQYPGLRAIQERSLLEEVRRSTPLFHPAVSRLTPSSFYDPTMVMNAAQAIQVARLYRRPDLLTLFDEHGLTAPGQRLLDIALTPVDEGHRSDMAAVNEWAEALGVAGWFERQAATMDH